MKLNKYIWDIYKRSESGKNTVRIFEECGVIENETIEILDKYLGESNFTPLNASYFVNDLFDTVSVPSELDMEQAQAFWEDIISKGILVKTFYDKELHIRKADDLLGLIPIISLWLYFKYPQFFKPYFFLGKFQELTKIADAFGVDLPDVPLKRYKEERLRYYWKLCLTFRHFQDENQLTDAEFCAFLYDFAPEYINSNVSEEDLPQPTQVWLCGGDKYGGDFTFLDNYKEEDGSSYWQGNVDTKRGDIIIMYCLSPRSYIHSIWRAVSDGIADPFFHFYSSINISKGLKVAPITIKQLKEDEYFGNHPLVRKNLQGISGYQINSEEYEKILTLITENGGEITQLPKLYNPTFQLNKTLKTEREVEISLIEPFLREIGYKENDWVRQLPVRMGRGERNFPDYSFLKNIKDIDCAYMLIEAKYWIKNNRELEDTFKQVWSYGLRLSSEILIIADKDAIWIYNKHNESFDRTKYLKRYWKELENPDLFNQVRRIVGHQ